MTIYKADLNCTVYYIIGFVILVVVTKPLYSSFSADWFPVIIISILFVLITVIRLRLNEIYLDKTNSNLILIYINYIGVKRTTTYDLGQIEFTYKRDRTSEISGINNVCSIYSFNKKVVQLVPREDDWSDSEIRGLVIGLVDSGVKKKFIGYGLKDVEI